MQNTLYFCQILIKNELFRHIFEKILKYSNSLEEVFVRNNTDHIFPYYIIFPNLQLARPSQAQISSSTPHALFSNILSLCTSSSVRDKVWAKCKTSRKIKMFCILKFIFLNNKLKTDNFAANNSKYSLSSICLYFLHECNLKCSTL